MWLSVAYSVDKFSCIRDRLFNTQQMAPKLILYYMPVSPASRAVVLLAKAIKIDLELKEIDISRGEHLTPEYRKVRKRERESLQFEFTT